MRCFLALVAVVFSIEPAVSQPLAIQDTKTSLGDSVGGNQTSAGGSELDALIRNHSNGVTFTGNLQNNHDILWVFFDIPGGGENVLSADNEDGPGQEIKQLAGLRFEAGFEADIAIRFDHGPDRITVKYLNLISNTYVDMLDDPVGTGLLPFVDLYWFSGFGTGPAVTVHWDNSNGAGVGAGTGRAGARDALSAATGITVSITPENIWDFGFTEYPWAKVCAVITDSSGSVLSNQALPGFGGLSPVSVADKVIRAVSLDSDSSGHFEKKIITESQREPQRAEVVDLDGDGDKDVVVLSSTLWWPALFYELAWYENDGGEYTKHSIPYSAFDARSISLEAADIDGDGDIDLLVSPWSYEGIGFDGTDAGTILVFENDGAASPTFVQRVLVAGVAPFPYPTSHFVSAINAVDMDTDGDLDLIVPFNDGGLSLLINSGGPTPTFTRVDVPEVTGILREVRCVDINADGLLDLVSFGFGVRWFEQDGSPFAFVDRGELLEGYPFGGMLMDMDLDGFLDIIPTKQGDQGWWKNDGLVSPAFTFVSTGAGFQVAVGTLATSHLGSGVTGGGVGRSFLALTRTGGELFVGPTVAARDIVIGSRDLAVTDHDGYGAQQIVVMSQGLDTVYALNSVWVSGIIQGRLTRWDSIVDAIDSIGQGNTLKAFAVHLEKDAAPVLRYDVPNSSIEPAAGSKTSFIRAAGSETWLKDNSNLWGWSLVDFRGSLTIESGSFGNPFIESAVISGPLTILPGSILRTNSLTFRGRAGFTHQEITQVPAVDLAIGDLDGDGDMDFATAEYFYSSNPGLYMVENDADGAGVFPVTRIADGDSNVETADLNGDGHIDLLVGRGGTVVWLENDGLNPPSFTSHLIGTHPATEELFQIGVYDLDQDGDLDVVTSGGYGLALQMHINDGLASPSFTQIPIDMWFWPGRFAITDLNGDSAPDLVVQNRSRLYWCENDGASPPTFGALNLLGALRKDLVSLRTGDLDGDGNVDVIAGNLEDSALVVFRNSGGATPTFTQTILDELDLLRDLEVADIDGDGDLDVLTALEGASAVMLHENDGATIVPELIRSTVTLRQPLAVIVRVGDMDGDGDLDVVSMGYGGAIALSANSSVREYVIDAPGSGLEVGGELRISNVGLEIGSGASVIAGGEVIVERSGRLTGGGSFETTVIRNGGFFGAGAGQSMTVIGDFENSLTELGRKNTGRIGIDLGDGSAPSRIDITGAAMFEGGLIVTADPAFTAREGAVFTAITSASRIDVCDIVSAPVFTLDDGTGTTLGTLVPAYTPTSVELVVVTIDTLLSGSSEFGVEGKPHDAVIADLTGVADGAPDGIPDLVIAIPVIDAIAPNGAVAILTGDTGPEGYTLSSLTLFTGAVVDAPVAVEVGDYDNDGDPEVAFANRGDNTGDNDVWVLEVDSTAPSPVEVSTLPAITIAPQSTVTDLATSQLVLVGIGGENLILGVAGSAERVVRIAAVSGTLLDWETCDIDTDGVPDSVDPIDFGAAALTTSGRGFAVSLADTDSVLVVLTDGAPEEDRVEIELQVGDSPRDVAAGDLDNDGFDDLVVINQAGGTVSVAWNIADPSDPSLRAMAPPVEIPASNTPDGQSLPGSLALADIDADGDLDIIIISTNELGERVVREIRNTTSGSGGLSFAAVTDTPDQPIGTPLLVRSADLDGDNEGLADDLVVLVSPEPGAGGGRSAPFVHQVRLFGLADACTADMNGDGILDNGDIGAFVSLFIAGDLAADMNGDGILDNGDIGTFVGLFLAGC